MKSRKTINTLLFVICCTLCRATLADFAEATENYRNKNYEAAMTEFKRSAVLGHKPSQFNIGVMYFRGEGVKQDLVEAYAWLAVAATDKDPSHIAVRDMVMSELDEKKKDAAIDRMEKLFVELAAESKNMTPILISEEKCKFHLKNTKKVAIEYPESLIDNGKEYSTDVAFTIDKFGAPRDYSVSVSTNKDFDTVVFKSLKRWRYEPVVVEGKSVEIADAQIRVRFRITGGRLDPHELKKYTDELRAKVKSGNPNDLYAVAYIGALVPELQIKKEESAQWFYEAARAGVPRARYEIGKALFRGDGCEQDTYKGLRWLTMTAEEENTDAQYFLGVSLLSSDKIQEDKTKAIEWLSKAASGHHEKAMMRLAWILATDKDEQVRDPARALQMVNEVYKNYADKLRSDETLAAAQAINGMFDDAVKLQTAALREAKAIDYPLDEVQARLAAYKNKQPWIE